MTQLVQTLNNYSLKPLGSALAGLLVRLGNFFVILFNAYVEAREKQAAYELARYLKQNRDFASYSEIDLFHMILERKLDSENKTKG